MHRIAENGIITLTAGDSLLAPLFLFLGNSSTEKYTLDNDDRLYFSIMMPHQDFEHAIVRKIYTKDNLDSNGDILVNLSTYDTENLRPGVYYYEAKLVITIGTEEYVDTVVPKRKFYII